MADRACTGRHAHVLSNGFWCPDCSYEGVGTTAHRTATENEVGILRPAAGILKPSRELVRLMKWMRAAFPAMLIAILGVGLMASAVICPLWILSASQDHMPCSHEGTSPESCPPSICQASSPYLVSSLGSATLPLLVELDSATIDPTISWNSLAVPVGQIHSESPPGAATSLFLRTHSLLI